MRLSIIPSDRTVCEDGKCSIGLTWQGTPANVHALQWYGTEGDIEYNDGKPNEAITELPEWALNAEAAWQVANKPPAPPTPEQIQSENKSRAVEYLGDSDWAATVDITDPTYSNPYLANQPEFLAYRSTVRAIAVDPPTTAVESWPRPPEAVWKYNP